ncbi:ras-like protein family member 10B [Schistocerca serialis cubense]|uniref:ras-like protein family member 10B n=1 Tax=Schistocerca serialis cubense TaxID=2023355 RepID=UPI00214E77DB|nr:ras-like protein family member 10B [Schistocerca serialis cubense]
MDSVLEGDHNNNGLEQCRVGSRAGPLVATVAGHDRRVGVPASLGRNRKLQQQQQQQQHIANYESVPQTGDEARTCSRVLAGPSGGGRPRGDHAARPPSAGADSCLSCVKVALLGASAVGKTSIVRQFVWNEFSDDYSATDRRYAYYPTVVINERLYELKVSDIPVIPYFPINSFYEWADFRFYGLRSANAYVLVFDLCNTDSFQYIRSLRDQMWESRDMRHVPVVVVGNKLDALQMHAAAAARRRDIVTLVRKHWKCAYVECSAKYNWRVVAVFKEVTRAVDAALHSAKDATSPMMDNFHGALDRNKCSIL